ncbi:MAG: YgiT-type zinc finger protein [Cyanobacteria bacterium P01_A01_bin.114]
MSQCHVCGSEDCQTEHVSEVFNIKGKFYLVENIPAKVCSRCGEDVFGKETTERIRLMLHGEDRPTRSISLDVFSYNEAVSK